MFQNVFQVNQKTFLQEHKKIHFLAAKYTKMDCFPQIMQIPWYFDFSALRAQIQKEQHYILFVLKRRRGVSKRGEHGRKYKTERESNNEKSPSQPWGSYAEAIGSPCSSWGACPTILFLKNYALRAPPQFFFSHYFLGRPAPTHPPVNWWCSLTRFRPIPGVSHIVIAGTSW